MNYPSLMIICINILFLAVWIIITFYFFTTSTLFNFATNVIQADYIKYITVAITACLFAVTMKIADLLDEHGLYLFKYADIVFGVLWGFFGSVLVAIDPIIANIIMAMMIGFVIRKRLDYINHIIAFFIVTSSFFILSEINIFVYFPFLFIILLLGSIKDLKYKQNKSVIQLFIKKIYLYIPLIYALPAFIYCIFYGNWSVFITFFMYDFSYNVTRIISKKCIWYKA